MKSVIVKDDIKREFLLGFLLVNGENPFNIKVEEDKISTDKLVLFSMVERFVSGETSVLPFKRTADILWCVLNSKYYSLIKHAKEIERFIVPTLAEPFSTGRNIIQFDPQKQGTSFLGFQLFPEGYLVYRSPKNMEKEVWRLLNHWTQLDSQRPEIALEEIETSPYTLRRQFQQALALQNWDEAERALSFLRQGHYISDENCHFLHIQLLSSQNRWNEIWDSPDYHIITGLDPLPRAVRGTLITAFYKCVILEEEGTGSVEKILELFRQHATRLGTILGYRAGLNDNLFIRVFAYKAAVDNNLEKLMRLHELTDSPDTMVIINRLQVLISGNEDIEDDKSKPWELALKAFQERDYDDSYIYAIDCPDGVKRTQLLLGIATMTEDFEIVKDASGAFLELNPEEQNEILMDPNSKGWAKFVLGYFIVDDESNCVRTLPINWAEWFKAVLIQSIEKNLLLDSLDNLVCEKSFEWQSSQMAEVEDLLAEFITNDRLIGGQRTLLKRVVSDFATILLQDSQFPRQSGETLYEYLIIALREFGSKNVNNTGFLLKLCEGLLLIDINCCQKLWNVMTEWFSFQPTVKFSFYMLEFLNLFHEYGLDKDKLALVWVNWADVFSATMSSEMYTQIKAWLKLGSLIGVDANQLEDLEAIVENPVEVDYIAKMSKAVIVIFSCRDKAAHRAANEIMARNPDLIVRVCTDNRLTDEAKVYASNSEIVIVVTACISHALTYGISPYLKRNPLYPQSSGETGIIMALEDFAKQTY